MKGLSPLDPSSFSRPELALVTDIKLALTVDFKKHIFHGSADLTVKKVDPDVTEIVLDSKGLKIAAIYEIDLDKPVTFDLSKPVGEFGSKLTVELPPKEGKIYTLSVRYETQPNASGLQWLEPEQTAGKEFPYVFSQFQAVHARSVIPCQDTPAVKATYTALITAPSGLTVVMSSPRHQQKETPDSTNFFFVQKVPIPSYLIAIAVGALESRQIGPRSHVWAEKEIIEEAAYEFADTEKQLQKAEEICGPYVWGIYDLLVLPPSFPFGGMENPCLTFVTPTLLAGDRSLANVVAHEIAHSWTGNLVTNRNFEHFWLNEGFTMFVERKIIGHLTSPQEQDFQALCGTGELRETIDHLGEDNPLTCLVVDLEHVHPDDSFSRVPYEKGHTFLRYLEIVVGGPSVFEPFLRIYFDAYKYKSLDTEEFKAFFKSYFKETPCTEKIDWDTWLYQPGMPPVIPAYDRTLIEVCITYKKRWLEWEENVEEPPFNNSDLKKLSSSVRIQLLQEIFEGPPQTISKLQAIEKVFGFDSVKNSEIKFRWLRIGLKARWEKKIAVTLDWINEIGRMKFVRPLYRDLYNWEEAREQGIENFKQNRHTMMHVCAYTVAKDLHFDE